MTSGRYHVVGKPVGHSLSPRIHAMFAEQLGIALDYSTHEIDAGQFDSTMDRFRAEGVGGVNVTLPYKEAAFRYVDDLDGEAQRAGAVNTIVFGDDRVLGCNTDGRGLVNDIQNRWHHHLVGKRVLVLGAGGATRGILGPLCDSGVAQIVIANRTIAKAQALVEEFATQKVQLSAQGLPWTRATQIDTVINGASLGHQGAHIRMLIEPDALAGCWCYDLSYGPSAILHAVAQEAASFSVDGLGMLVEQAALAFEIWHGVQPATEPVMEVLRARG